MKQVTRLVILLLGVVTTIGISTDAQENTSAAIARIRSASPSPLPKLSPAAGFGAGSGITIENNSKGTLVAHFLGTTTKSVTVQTGDSTDVTLAAGNYEIALEVPKSRTKSFYGQMRVDENVFYRLNFSVIVEENSSPSSTVIAGKSTVTETGLEGTFDDTVWRGNSKGYEYTLFLYFGGKYVLEIKNLTPQPNFVMTPGGLKQEGYYTDVQDEIGIWVRNDNRIIRKKRSIGEVDTVTPPSNDFYDASGDYARSGNDFYDASGNFVRGPFVIRGKHINEIIFDGIQLKFGDYFIKLFESKGEAKETSRTTVRECTLTRIGTVFGALLDSKKQPLSLKEGAAESVAGTVWRRLQYGEPPPGIQAIGEEVFGSTNLPGGIINVVVTPESPPMKYSNWKPKLEINQFHPYRIAAATRYWPINANLSLEFLEGGLLTCTSWVSDRFLRKDNSPQISDGFFYSDCKMLGSWKQEGNRLLIKIGTSSRTCEKGKYGQKEKWKKNWENSENYEIEMRAVIVGNQMRGVTLFDYKNTKHVSEHQQNEWTLAKVTPNSQKGSGKVGNKRAKRS